MEKSEELQVTITTHAWVLQLAMVLIWPWYYFTGKVPEWYLDTAVRLSVSVR